MVDVSTWEDAFAYPLRGEAAGRRLLAGALPFTLLWAVYVFLAMAPPEGQQLPLMPDGVVALVRQGATVSLLVSPGYLILLGYYARVLDETLDRSRRLAGFGAPLSMARGTALAVVTGAVFLALGVGLVIGSTLALSLLAGRPASSLPLLVTRSVAGLVGLGVGHVGAAQLVALLTADRRTFAPANVSRALSLAARPAVAVAAVSVAGLLFVGGVFGYSLYVVVYGLAVGVAGPLSGPTELALLAGASIALGAGVHYVALCAVRAYGLVAGQAVEQGR